MFERSWITRQIADTAGLRRVTSEQGKEVVGRRDREDYAGILFPYVWPGTTLACAHRIRRDNPPYTIRAGSRVEDGKYLSAPGYGNKLYFHPLTPAASLLNPTIPIVLFEGEKKTLAGFRFSYEAVSETDAPIFVSVGISGVWGWRDGRQKAANPTGKRVSVSAPIRDLARITWVDRKAYILFDSNVQTNPKVAAARVGLARELAGRGAEVWFVDLPVEDGVNGIDDYLARHGTRPALKLLEAARLFDPQEQLAKLQYTDHGNEQAFEALFGDDFLYNWTAKQWVRWNGILWVEDLVGSADRAMIEVAHARLQATSLVTENATGFEFAAGSAEERRKRAIAGALRLQNIKGRHAALESAQTNPRFARREEDFDQDDYLFGCGNGVLDLRTAAFRPGRREDMLTQSTQVYWVPGATCETWLGFLQGVFPGRPDMIAFIKRAVGYSLLGLTREEVFFILYGVGRNGKGTFLRVLLALLGGYAVNAEFSTLVADRDRAKGPRNDIAALAGKRLVTAQESRDGAQFDESLIKTLTGGDLITARFLHREFFTFRPTWKIWLATNHKPEIKGTDTGIWSRPRLVPFTVSFEGREDRGLKDALLAPKELSGVLRWAIEGCREYLAEEMGGLQYPEEVLKATADYRSESDLVGQFLAECCRTGQGEVKARALYQSFSKWAEGTAGLTETAFGRRMTDRGLTRVRTDYGNKYTGLALIEGG